MSQYRQYLQKLSTHSATTAFICKAFLGLKLLDEFFLGLHLSKDALTCTIINDHYTPVYRRVIDFKKDLPAEYTKNSNPAATWVAALDKLFTDIAESLEFDLGRVSAIGGSTEPGLAIWKEGAEVVLRNLDLTSSLSQQLEGMLLPLDMDSNNSDRTAPDDNSTPATNNVADQLLQLTDDVIKQSERISLPGSLLASLLIGKYAETDLSDASMAGIWNKHEQALDNRLVDRSKDLKDKLGSFTSTSDSLGHLTAYCAKRWRMSTKCIVLPFVNSKSVDLINLNLTSGDCLYSMDKQDSLSWYVPVTQTPHPNAIMDPRHPDLESYCTFLLTGTKIRSRTYGDEWIQFGNSLRNLGPGCHALDNDAPKVTRFSFVQREQQDAHEQLQPGDNHETLIIRRYEDGEMVAAFQPREKEMPEATNLEWETSHLSSDQLIQFKIAQYDARSLMDTMLLSIRFQLESISQGRSDAIRRIMVIGHDPMSTSGSLLQLVSNALNLPVFKLRKIIETGTSSADTKCILAGLLSRFSILRTDALKELEQPGPIEASLIDDPKLRTATWEDAVQKERSSKEKKAITTFSKMIDNDAIVRHDHLLIAEPQPSEVEKYDELYKEFCHCRRTMFKNE
ncbi:hypothetical protein BC943DRAFT_328992 [Umbelopsis sp. AD052]|nr:hypothetical protein BC943DRAFT_328992 [Umbelopsis sp. AD052]